ncbi:MAG: hypothetical protein IPL32_11370 [Chloracidobacterium sp.]|nr:hypothetical protein [Chloracidobacterium sp.]
MGDKFVECGNHGKSNPAFICWHLMHEANVGWNDAIQDEESPDDPFYGCIKAHCNKCESIAIKTTGFVEQSFANIQLVCEECALKIKRANMK